MLEALKVLVTENFANLTPHPLQVLLTYSHPPMSVRLAAIEKLPE
jgi:STE24 endopeptidase